MRILFVLENYIPHIGGVETVFRNLAESLVKLGHDVYIVTHRLKRTKKFEVINGVKVYRVNCFQSRYLFTFFSVPLVFRLAKHADIIHTTSFNGAPPAWLASKLRKKPAIITVHEVWINRWRELAGMNIANAAFHNLLEKLIYSLSYDRYACVSKFTQNALISSGIKEKKTEVIYNGVEYGHWNPKKYDGKKIRKKLGIEGKFVIMCYGRPGVSKGIEYAIEAMPYIIDKIKNALLILILSKDKAYAKRNYMMREIIEKLKIQEKVIVCDPVDISELPNYHKASDCIVVPSLSEGFGYTVAESCAMRVPVIASNVGSIPEVISGKYVLVKPKDPKEIANGVLKVYNNKAKDSKLKKFEWAKTIREYIKAYKELVK